MDVNQDNILSVEELELGEIRKTDCQKTDELEIVSVSQDEAKVLSIVKETKLVFIPFDDGC